MTAKFSTTARIRLGHAGDAEDLAAIFRSSWELAYRGVIPHLALERMIRNRGPQWWRQAGLHGEHRPLLLAIDGKLAGYATSGRSRSRGRPQGEIYELYLAPTYQGLGFGERLFEAARTKLDERGLSGLLVWVLADNTPACNFYWRRGGRPVTSSTERFGAVRLEKIAFVWE